jgi:tRNA (uracil-5-)-methyltransferase
MSESQADTPAEVSISDAAMAVDGLVQEAPRTAPAGLSLTIHNLPKTMNDTKFNKKVKELGIKYLKADKPFNKTAGRLRFENQEDRQAALTALTHVVVDGVAWAVRVPADMGGEIGANVGKRGPGGFRSRDDKNKVGEDGDSEGEEGVSGAGEDGEEQGKAATTVKEAVAPWHHLDYPHQTYKKYRAMRDILEKIVKRAKKDSVAALPEWLSAITKQKLKWLACPLEQVTPSPLTEGYRNKTELTIAMDIHGKPAIGFTLGAMKNGVVAVGNPAEAPMFSRIHAELHQLLEPFVANSGLPVWDKTTHTGFWRLLLLRSTMNEDSLIMFQVNPGALTPERFEKVKQDLVQFVTTSESPASKKIKSIWIQEHTGVSNAADLNAPKQLLWGEEYLQEEMLGTKFRISPTSFFQVNTPAATLLYDLVREWCGELDDNTTLFDVCCGTGTIGLCIAKNSVALKEIVGLEIVEDAVMDAKANAVLNGITNARFIVGKAEDTMNRVVNEYPGIKKVIASGAEANGNEPVHKFVAVLDPPRGGVHPKVLRAIRDCEAITRVIYVSCCPNSLINDASVLTRYPSKSTSGTAFVPIKARPVDLFPHTPHTELVMMFQRHTPEAQATIDASQHLADNPPQRKRPHDDIAPSTDDIAAPSLAPPQPALEVATAESSSALGSSAPQ